jgi:DNA (cytosine-5)-methyltransferase 1
VAVRSVTIIELCAGVGGLGLGVRLAEPRSRCVAYIEREAYAAATLVARMVAGDLDKAPVWSDLATFDARPWRGAVDCIVSGDPCQPHSKVGFMQGADDQRDLIADVVRVFAESGASRLFRENVTGNADGQLAALVPPLESMGCAVAAGIFSAAEVGAPHDRERLFIMADAAGARFQGWNAAGHAAGQAAGRHLGAGGWWAAEPGVRRVANGLACRVDRLRACGGGAVPLVAAYAWRALSAVLAETRGAGVTVLNRELAA